MKKTIFIQWLLLFLLASASLSCKKYLEEKPDKTLVVPSSVDDLQGLLDDNNKMNSATPGTGETSADDYFVTPDNFNSQDLHDQQAYTFQLANVTFGNDWTLSYNAVFNSNYCLDKIDKAPKNLQNESKWNNVKGAAFFFRGFYFLNLSWEYTKAYDESTASDDLGIVLRLGSDFNVPSVRSTVSQSYNQAINDLITAAQYLPDFPLTPMRPSKVACYGVIARAYLSMRKYDSAYKYSDKALGMQNALLDYNSPEVSPDARIPFKLFNKEIIFFTTESGFYGTKYYLSALTDTVLYAQYDSSDLRKKIYFRPKDGYFNFKGSYATDGRSYFSGIATDELYLMRAECLARAGNINAAMDDVNTLLVKRYANGKFTPLTATTKEQAVMIILTERRKELLMRGHRWIDIKRLNKEGANITVTHVVGTKAYSLPPNDKRYALPIPDDIIALTGMQQN